MNKIININLGGMPFVIDEDAYRNMELYFNAIKQHFSASEGCSEIIYDIETRMAELFIEKNSSKQIISNSDLQNVIQILGKPEDFGAEAVDFDQETPSYQQGNTGGNSYTYIKTGKRLFRNEDDKVIGGVCSGIAAYLGIQDPLWVRLAFAAAVFLFGSSIMMYILLLIIIPKATTASDKLAMKGEPINIENIAKKVEEELSEYGQKINEFGKEITQKKKDDGLDEHRMGFANKALAGTGTLILSSFQIGKTLFKSVLGLAIAVTIFALTIACGSALFTFFTASDFMQFFGPKSPVVYSFSSASLLLVITIPLVMLVIYLSKWFFPQKETHYNRYLFYTWLVSIVAFFGFGSNVLREYSYHEQTIDRQEILATGQTINLQLTENNRQRKNFQIGNIFMGTNAISMPMRSAIDIVPSDSPNIVIEKERSARGADSADALKNLSAIEANPKIDGNNIEIERFFTIPKGNFFRDQQIKYTIHLPKGQKLLLPEALGFDINHPNGIQQTTVGNQIEYLSL